MLKSFKRNTLAHMKLLGDKTIRCLSAQSSSEYLKAAPHNCSHASCLPIIRHIFQKCSTSSSQAPHHSLPRRLESSFVPLLVLSPPKSLRWISVGTPEKYCLRFLIDLTKNLLRILRNTIMRCCLKHIFRKLCPRPEGVHGSVNRSRRRRFSRLRSVSRRCFLKGTLC